VVSALKNIKNSADILNEKIIEKSSPIVVGIDPILTSIPSVYKEKYLNYDNPFEGVARTYVDFAFDLIDAVSDIVPAVKPQIAFFEKYGHWGFWAFQEIVEYAHSKNLVVIEDAKRNDIGNTSKAYADGHLGKVDLLDGSVIESVGADWLTITPFLGRDSLKPFINCCKSEKKGLFILVKTSNEGGSDYQDLITKEGKSVYEIIAEHIKIEEEGLIGTSGYSPLGVVVGATHPLQAKEIRKLLPHSIFLVPGYGAQGGDTKNIASYFNKDGLGAIINSSRAIMNSWKESHTDQSCTQTDFKNSVRNATLLMRDDIIDALRQ